MSGNEVAISCCRLFCKFGSDRRHYLEKQSLGGGQSNANTEVAKSKRTDVVSRIFFSVLFFLKAFTRGVQLRYCFQLLCESSHLGLLGSKSLKDTYEGVHVLISLWD